MVGDVTAYALRGRIIDARARFMPPPDGFFSQLIQRLGDWLRNLLTPQAPVERPRQKPAPAPEIAPEPPSLPASEAADPLDPAGGDLPAGWPAAPASSQGPPVPFVPNSPSDPDRATYGGR
jgi:hypothetical protein